MIAGHNVYIVDDDDVVRGSLESLLALRPDTSVRSFGSGDAFLAGADGLESGCLLLDLHMPGLSGIDVLKAIGDHAGKFVAIVLTGKGDVSLAVQAMKAGAVDFLEKPCAHRALIQAIDTAIARLERSSLEADRVAAATAKLALLSARERDVLKGLIEGLSNKVIAYQLEISPRTVEIYRAKLMEKLEVRSLSEALGIAFAAGMFPRH
ncbi:MULTISPECIES: response regulator transcription factor [Sphingomonadales]|uniref:DNA-binding response regulator n=2 Tax=Edaphosphingomonas TaxID=3423724 RepID=A0A2T4I798_9SPHN|nr:MULTISPECIES: response regulator [Sphingomonas]AGH49065.1 response regulator receiver protein [Sphingomonas sp. MM-1]OHT21486.1 Transcriptional regulatory protein FixJ [Sphingomonas haloaromaticamans]PTD26966.1 DNA-binding response regulator [Sphingomonas fennica]